MSDPTKLREVVLAAIADVHGCVSAQECAEAFERAFKLIRDHGPALLAALDDARDLTALMAAAQPVAHHGTCSSPDEIVRLARAYSAVKARERNAAFATFDAARKPVAREWNDA